MPTPCTPKICLFCLEMVKGRLESWCRAAQLPEQGHVMEGPFSVADVFPLKGLGEILLWKSLETRQWDSWEGFWMLLLCRMSGWQDHPLTLDIWLRCCLLLGR